ncbi:DUF6090 family protein [Winogradskyella aurantia]|uniref:Uncharacterized protein n=1 Tax=Winogradskyella aurantia TaxID=1915063 RepID=A0A265URW7_9FLAO|nr:DUF6090 family protein [Winogradskyella aurantia]OZV68055.1 hypothetical protein CA834_10435 [Winogradskyella aurantia]
MIKQEKPFRYLKYAIGEIILVVIGILIALQINNWNDNEKKKQLKSNYIENLINDLTKDSIQLQNRIDENHASLKAMNAYLSLIQKEELSEQDIYIKYLKESVFLGIRVINTYNTNTFNILTSSGNIDLFSNAFNNSLMELNRVQNAELEVSKLNSSFYLQLLSNLSTQYPTDQTHLYRAIIRKTAGNLDPNKFAVMYFNLLDHQRHTINRYLELSQIVMQHIQEMLQKLHLKQNL